MKNEPQEKNSNEESIKIILIGEVYTGKTSLINVYIKKEFDKKVESTISPSYFNKTIRFEDKTYIIYLWDTAGQEQFRSMNKIFIKDSNIIIFIYDITRKNTLKELSFWIEYVESIVGKDNSVYGVVGNKVDLFDKIEELKEANPNIDYELVNTEEGKAFAEKIGAEFLETSAKEKAVGFDNFIYKLVDEYRSKNMFSEKPDFISLGSTNLNKKKKCCH